MTLSRDTVKLAYRLFLNRDPVEGELQHMLKACSSEAALRRVFLGSAEFLAQVPARRTAASGPLTFYCEFDAEGLVDGFSRTRQVPESGLVTNFLGMRVRPSVYPVLLEKLAGTVEPRPNPTNWHADIAEWASALRSVEQARGRYRIVELGCGWGCWISNMGVAARSRGLKVDLIGVEGDSNHLANARETLTINGFAPDEYRLVHGIAGPKPGKAIFPDPDAGDAHWGGEPEFYPDATRLAEAQGTRGLQVLDCHTLDDLGAGGVIDLLHIDIQGGEAAYVTGNAEAMSRLVRRVLIGTHSREIEGALFAHFRAQGWLLEMERPAVAPPRGGQPFIQIDGVQLWHNPALKG